MSTVFNLFMWETFVDWSEKVNVNRLANGSRFNTSLDAVDVIPFGVIRSHLEHIDEINVFCNLYYLKIMRIFVSLI